MHTATIVTTVQLIDAMSPAADRTARQSNGIL